MCHQAVGLIQGCIETAGIASVSIALLREMAISVRPPRALWVPFPMGFPLGEPRRPDIQQRVILAALDLLGRHASEAILETYHPPAGPSGSG